MNPSRTLLSSIDFFHPQSCSFLQNLCSVSLYLDFFGSLFTTAMVNCAKWLQPVDRAWGGLNVSGTARWELRRLGDDWRWGKISP